MQASALTGTPMVQGDPGLPARLVQGSTSTLPAEADATSTLTELGDAQYRLDLAIPRGEPGAPGGTDAATAGWVKTGTQTRAALDQAYRRGYSVKEYGAIGNGTTDDTAAIQAAANAALAAGSDATLYFPEGTYRTSGTIQIKCAVDGRAATIAYYGTGTAVLVGDESNAVVARKEIWLPRIVNRTNLAAKRFDGASIGVRLVNLNTCQVGFDFIQAFEEGMVCEGRGQGWVHNTVHLGSLWGNHRNLVLRPSAHENYPGWVQSNLFLNGRLSLSDTWGAVDDPNAGQIVMLNGPSGEAGPGANTWIGTSIEGAQYERYRIAFAGRFNQLINLRWENQGPNPMRIHYGPQSYFNWITGGYGLVTAVEVFDSLSGGNRIVPAEAPVEARSYAVNALTVASATATPVVWSGFNGYRAEQDAAGTITPRPGRWQINATVAAQFSHATGFVEIRIVKNDGTLLGVERYPLMSTQMRTLQVSARETFAPGQSFRVEVYHTNNGTMTTSPTGRYSRLQLELL
ncbi:hypothetical protein EK0264_03795 [Epidermidibacterium keratini]|uniref:Rhamnogalacturonase A/B/Epimerase-like pectate lyase domain-containing protein n=2 Tax=Epidermidibacterium keratini TaxID=1891644 RepID=A0A7L4YSN0_9ACTN|nr:hypothetical protein EK0264_03795 [Epidermidibacterium keratini]